MSTNSLYGDTSFLESLNTLLEIWESSSQKLDGRKNSDDDDNLFKDLWTQLGSDYVKSTDPRDWWDIKFKNNPINFKSIALSTNTADNVSAIEALLWAFTDLSEEQIKHLPKVKGIKSKHEKVLYYLKNNKFDLNRDYYYLVFDKNSKKFILTSIKRLASLVANGNNLPFQCNFFKQDASKQAHRTFNESYNYVVGTFEKSIRKRCSILEYLNNNPFDYST